MDIERKSNGAKNSPQSDCLSPQNDVDDDYKRIRTRSRQEETRAWRQEIQRTNSENDDNELVFLKSKSDEDYQKKAGIVVRPLGTPQRRSRNKDTPPPLPPRKSPSPNRSSSFSPTSSKDNISSQNDNFMSQKDHKIKNNTVPSETNSRNRYRHHPSTNASDNYHKQLEEAGFSPFTNAAYSNQNGLKPCRSSDDEMHSSFFPHQSSMVRTRPHSLSPMNTPSSQNNYESAHNNRKRAKSHQFHISSKDLYNQQQHTLQKKFISQTHQNEQNIIILNRSRSISYHSDEGESSNPFHQQQQQKHNKAPVSKDSVSRSNLSKNNNDSTILNRSRSISYHSDEGESSNPFHQQQRQKEKERTRISKEYISNATNGNNGIIWNRSRSRSFHSDKGESSNPFHHHQQQQQLQKEFSRNEYASQSINSNNGIILNRSRSRSFHSDKGESSNPFHHQQQQQQRESNGEGYKVQTVNPNIPVMNSSSMQYPSLSNYDNLNALRTGTFQTNENVTAFPTGLSYNVPINYQATLSIVDNESSSDSEIVGNISNSASIIRDMNDDEDDDVVVGVMNGSSTLLPMPQPTEQTAKEQMIERERQSRKERERARLKRQLALNYSTNDDDHGDDDMTHNCLEQESIACTIGAEDSIMVLQVQSRSLEDNEDDDEINNTGIIVADNPDDQIPLGYAMERFLSDGVVVESRQSNNGEDDHPNSPSNTVAETASVGNEISVSNNLERRTMNESNNQQENIMTNSESVTAAITSRTIVVTEVGNAVVATTPNSIIHPQDDENHSSILEDSHQREEATTEISSPENNNFLDDFSSQDNRIIIPSSTRETEEREIVDESMMNPNSSAPRLARLTEAEILEMAEIDYASIGNMPPHSHVASSVSSSDTRTGFRNFHESGLSFAISEGNHTQTTVQESSNTSATTISVVELHSSTSDEIILSATSSSSSHHRFELVGSSSDDNNSHNSRTLDEEILSVHDRILTASAGDDGSTSSLLANQSVGEAEINISNSSSKQFHSSNEEICESSHRVVSPRSYDNMTKTNDRAIHNKNDLENSFSTASEISFQGPNRSIQPRIKKGYHHSMKIERAANQPTETPLFMVDDFEYDKFQLEPQKPPPPKMLDETSTSMAQQFTPSSDYHLNNTSGRNYINYGATAMGTNMSIQTDKNDNHLPMHMKGINLNQEIVTLNIPRGDDDNEEVKDVFRDRIDSVFSSIRSLSTLDIEAEMKDSDNYVTNSIFSSAFPERFIVLLITLIIEIPVLLTISGGGDRLCQEIGRAKYQLLMALLPLSCAVSGNVGLQSDRVTISAISHMHLTKQNYFAWLCKELGISCLLGISVGFVLGTLAYQASNHDFSFTLAIFIAQFVSIMMGGLVGTLSPLLLTYIFHRDSIKWGGPLVTAVQDIIGSLTMVVFSYYLLVFLGPFKIDPRDTCG